MKNILICSIVFILFFAVFVQAEEDVNLFDTPVNPELYLIRPGDKLLVTFIHSQIEPVSLTVDPEGKIVHETIGLINLQNQTLAYAKNKLTETLKELYNDSQIEVSITEPRQVSIAVFGSVKKPGIYRGLTTDRVSDLITKAGGLLENGSTRNIKFISENKVLPVDLDKAKYLGDVFSNPYLYAGKAIEVPSKSSETIHIVGDVNSPREIELQEGDDLAMMIQLAGKFKNFTTMSDVQIIRGNKRIDNNNIQAKDVLVVKSSVSQNTQQVKLFGAVSNQGVYAYNASLSLDDLLRLAGGVLTDANKNSITVFRKPLVDSHGEKSIVRYPISIPYDNVSQSSILLEVNDSIFVPWQVGFVKVSGSVLNPGYFPYQFKKDVLFYIKSAGGFLPTSNKDEVQIFNPISKSTSVVHSGVLVPDGAEIIIQVKEELK